MAGTLIVSNITTDTDNTFIVRSNTGTTLFTANTTGIDTANSIAANAITSDKILSVANTKISGNIVSSQITSVANTQITGNIASSQITSNPTLYGNVSVTGVIGVGGATTSTSGSGISFPATQSASSDANTLDDYEEGTWTPTLSPASGSITTLTTAGWYVKVGRSVTIYGYWLVSNAGTAAGSWSVGGLPFNTLNTGTYGGGSRGTLTNAREDALTGYQGQIFWNNNTTNGQVQKYDGNNYAWTSGYVLVTCGTYETAS